MQAEDLLADLRKVSSKAARSALHIESAKLTALVRLEPGVCFSGRLTPWPQEAELLWQYLQCPQGAFSLHVKDALRLDQPVIVSSVRGSRGNVSLKHALFQTNAQVLNASSVLVTSQGIRLTLPEVFERWGCDPNSITLADVPCLWTPEVILALLLRGRWENLLLKHSVHHIQKQHGLVLFWLRSLMQWPTDEDMVRLQGYGKTCVQAPSHALDAEDARFLLHWLRDHASAIIRESNEPEAMQLKLEQASEGLQVFLLAFQAGAASAGTGGKRLSNLAKSAEHLVNSIRVARHVRNKSKLARIQNEFLDAAMPPALQNFAKAAGRKPVSGSTISKSQALGARTVSG